MPYVDIKIIEGASRTQKVKIVSDITKSLVSVLGKKQEHIHIVIHDVAEENWGYSGALTDEWISKHET